MKLWWLWVFCTPWMVLRWARGEFRRKPEPEPVVHPPESQQAACVQDAVMRKALEKLFSNQTMAQQMPSAIISARMAQMGNLHHGGLGGMLRQQFGGPTHPKPASPTPNDEMRQKEPAE